MTPAEALGFIVDMDISKWTYKSMRIHAKMHGHHDLYPSYKKILKVEEECIPKSLDISEMECKVSLQDLLDHTVKRLFLSLQLNLNTNLTLYVKYSLNRYEQKCYDRISASDCSFCSSIVPLKLVDEQNNVSYWTNLTPFSSRFYRPIKIIYEKETSDLIVREEANLKSEIENLKDIKIGNCNIGFNMMRTMIDEKAYHALNCGTSQTCLVCGSDISNLNNIDDLVNRQIKDTALQYGFSISHVLIRFMELVLQVSYRIEIKMWKISPDKSDIVLARKKFIKNGLRKKLGILVDIPILASENTNDIYASIRFFRNIKTVAAITGFDKELLWRFKTILCVLFCEEQINKEAFKEYAINTAKRFVNIYSWYIMPPSMHIVLVHGHSIMDQFFLPMKILLGETLSLVLELALDSPLDMALEANDKNMSRIETITDMMRQLFLYSDPHISLISQNKTRNKSQFNSHMKTLLILKENDNESDDSNVDTSEESDFS